MEQARRYAAYLRECATSDYYTGSMARFQDFNVTPQLSQITMPVLVFHRRDAPFPALELVRKLVAATPLARLLILEGSAVFPFLGDTEPALAAIAQFLEEADERPDGLTEREQEILALLASGSSNEQIARDLSISTRTVERHISNIYLKIGVHNRAEATAYAFRNRIALV
jgi:DNA-binding CsgD family transcriptional regulator